MPYMILDQRAETEIVKNAERLGFKPVPSDYIKGINESVAGHPDMQLVKIGNDIIVNPESLNHYKKHMPEIKFIAGKTVVQGKYPHYVAYNVALTSDFAIHNFKYTDEAVKERLSGFKLINVKQGYAKCSVLTLPNGIITSDEGIISRCGELDALKIRHGEITLIGNDYGFIGGASGYHDGKLYFSGNIKKHPDYDEIKKFCENKCIEIICLSNDKLADIGSIIII